MWHSMKLRESLVRHVHAATLQIFSVARNINVFEWQASRSMRSTRPFPRVWLITDDPALSQHGDLTGLWTSDQDQTLLTVSSLVLSFSCPWKGIEANASRTRGETHFRNSHWRRARRSSTRQRIERTCGRRFFEETAHAASSISYVTLALRRREPGPAISAKAVQGERE